jgi:hypothetical protein
MHVALGSVFIITHPPKKIWESGTQEGSHFQGKDVPDTKELSTWTKNKEKFLGSEWIFLKVFFSF